jgi:hypothetical protein
MRIAAFALADFKGVEVDLHRDLDWYSPATTMPSSRTSSSGLSQGVAQGTRYRADHQVA